MLSAEPLQNPPPLLLFILRASAAGGPRAEDEAEARGRAPFGLCSSQGMKRGALLSSQA